MGWQQDRTGIKPGGVVGGDLQAADAHSIRYEHTNRPGAVVTVYAYAEHRAGHYGTTVLTELVVCTDPRDPGGTELWSDHIYSRRSPSHTSIEAADRQACDVLRQHRHSDIRWDGRAPWEDR